MNLNINEIGTPKLNAEPVDGFGTLEELDCRGRRVFLRVDPYVVDSLGPPVPKQDAEGALAPAPGSSLAVPHHSTLRRLLELEARVIVATHLSPDSSSETGLESVESLASRLSEQLEVEVLMPDECVGDAAVRALHNLRQGQICVLPDLATCGPGELANDETFARALSSYVDAYVGDAFSASHLAYASLVRLPKLVPRRALGYRARRELQVLSSVFALSRGSVAMALGGLHFSDKIDVLTTWLPRLNKLCVGGGVASTLLAAAGRGIPGEHVQMERLAQARSLLTRARDLGVEVLLPSDLRVQLPGDRGALVVSAQSVPAGARILDVGPESARKFTDTLGAATHVLWWGPLGNLKHEDGVAASRQLAELCARPTSMSVVLGGDTRRFVRQLPPEIEAGIDLVSTGSAAAKAMLCGRTLPGIEALRVRH
jgi:phosphoglycerate kinase